MIPKFSRRDALRAATAGAAVSLIGAQAAEAAGCNETSKLAKPRDLANIPEKFLKRQTLSEVHLEKWRGVGNLFLRMRRLTIAPGGFVPTHYHDDRPSIVYMLKGELWEHNSFCSEPIVHREGDWTAEFGPFVGHWWENRTNSEAIVLSADVIPPEYKDMADMDM
ncbi:cupin domain-containing protein [Methylobacterium sp. CCH7-A2]|jgi:quercetin dioxygenase-like cupin family protein|uniref:cupin domain-containing protein n=1 Tax=Methylobacterium sp. CCH7-A2 TaxID=1768789 RepID=UPI00083568D9|nr:cupin domain-containing protein [Methylobacterium sp. CCH7-A2]